MTPSATLNFRQADDLFKYICRRRNVVLGKPLPVWDEWKKASEAVKSVCRRLMYYALRKDKTDFLIGMACVLKGEFWDNMSAICARRFPMKYDEELYLERERGEKALALFQKENGLTEGELFAVPDKGESLALSFVRGGTLSPWCFVSRLGKVPGNTSNRAETQMTNIIKEICNGLHP